MLNERNFAPFNMFKYAIIYFVFINVIHGSPPNARIEKQYKSWILYLGLREISRDAPTMNMNNTSKNKISSLNNIHIPTEPKIEHFWTSGSDLGEEGQFVLLATGKKFNFTHWRYPQPDNAGKIEHCTEIWKLREKRYNWNDVSCANNFNFICEVQKCTDLCKS